MIDEDIRAERKRQDKIWGEQNHHPFKWLGILMEEVGEASKAVLTKDMLLYRSELIHVAAVAVAMVECLDRGKWKELPIQSPTKIEAAIKYLEKEFDKMKTENHPWGSYQELRRNINLLKYVLNQPQEERGYPGSTWTDKDLGLEETPK